jgi:hypothetical protein
MMGHHFVHPPPASGGAHHGWDLWFGVQSREVWGWPRGHLMVHGATMASAVTFIVVLIVVPGKWNSSRAVPGAAEMNEALTDNSTRADRLSS